MRGVAGNGHPYRDGSLYLPPRAANPAMRRQRPLVAWQPSATIADSTMKRLILTLLANFSAFGAPAPLTVEQMGVQAGDPRTITRVGADAVSHQPA